MGMESDGQVRFGRGGQLDTRAGAIDSSGFGRPRSQQKGRSTPVDRIGLAALDYTRLSD